MSLEEFALKNMARLLSREDRSRLFEELCRIVGEPIPEKVWLKTRIRKTDVYRYLPKTRSKRGGLVPNSTTTIIIIKALNRSGEEGLQSVLSVFDPIEREMRRTVRKYFSWKKYLTENVFYNPLSRAQISKLERSLY
jgi:ArsR family metal-binding transcriptional regulator